jgi:hypothetical protein
MRFLQPLAWVERFQESKRGGFCPPKAMAIRPYSEHWSYAGSEQEFS